MPFTGAAACNRDAVLTTSPATSPFAVRGARSERHESLAGVDRDAHFQLELGIASFSSSIGITDREGGANGALGIVAVSDRRTEDRHHRVADELLDDAAEALDLRAHPREVGRQDRADVLRVEPLGARREADEIREEDGDDLALLEQALRLVGERFSAGKAELRNRRVLLAALRTNRHRPSVRVDAEAV